MKTPSIDSNSRYIHGGAWRDPEIDSSQLNRAHAILKDPLIPNIIGFASINYRLSPYPDHPRDPSSPDDPSRNAKHPNHIHDVLAALRWLQKEYGFGERYLLAGHSCGATLAFQVAMIRQEESVLAPAFTKPLAILGVEGIYDLVALRDNHKDEPVYQQIVENVFGTDEAWWAACSPVSGDYNKHWPNGKLTVIAHSLEDELVEKDQMHRMKEALNSQRSSAMGGSAAQNRLDTVQILTGKHDEIWKEATELAKSIANAIERLGHIMS